MASAQQILLSAVEAVLGEGTDVARYLAKAIDSDDALDLLLAQAAFEDLPSATKREIARRVAEQTEAELMRRENARKRAS
jgi:hypothetical protein